MPSVNQQRSGYPKKSNEHARLFITSVLGVAIGYFLGISLPGLLGSQSYLLPRLSSSLDVSFIDRSISSARNNTISSVTKSVVHRNTSSEGKKSNSKRNRSLHSSQIYADTNPRGAELLPPGIVVSHTDFYLRRLWGDPDKDLTSRPKYLVTFTVGYNQRKNIDAAIKKFSDDFTVLLFHYDGRASEWDEFEWSKRAVHISVRRQAKWWYAKRFLHPDIVAAYDYIFIWDEDLGLEHFNAEKYLGLVKKHKLEISQPGLEPAKGLTWEMTKRRGAGEMHKEVEEKPGWCNDPHLPPCAAFVEIMAPVFSRDAWSCVWHMLQNDLVHGWGLDFAVQRCVEPAHEKIGVVDSQWIVHQVVPTLGEQGGSEKGKAPWQAVRDRCKYEWSQFQSRLANADTNYFAGIQHHHRHS